MTLFFLNFSNDFLNYAVNIFRTRKVVCKNVFKTNGSQDILTIFFRILWSQTIVIPSYVVNKTQTTKNQENTTHRF